MAQTDNTNFRSVFKTYFEREKLTCSENFNDWYRSLRIVLRVTGQLEILKTPCPAEPEGEAATEAAKAKWNLDCKEHIDVAAMMLGAMSTPLQRQFEEYLPMNMIDELKKLYEKPSNVEIYDLMEAPHGCKQGDGEPVSAHVLKMKSFMDQLQTLKKPYDNDMAVNLINRSLNKDFNRFVRNFNMHCVGKTVREFHTLFIDYEKGLTPKAPTPQVLAIQGGRINKPNANKKKGKGNKKADKNKQVMAYQPPQPKKNPPVKNNPKKDQGCHYCKVMGHWKRNCPLYLDDLRNNKVKKIGHMGASTSGNFFVIELFTLSHKLNSWLYDTGCGINICNTLQGFREERRLAYGEQFLHVGNGAQAAVEAIGMFDLVLPSGLVLCLNNCHYAPSIIRGVVSFSCLLDLGFSHTIDGNKFLFL